MRIIGGEFQDANVVIRNIPIIVFFRFIRRILANER